MVKEHTAELDQLLKRLEEAENEFKEKMQGIEKIQQEHKESEIQEELESIDE